MSITIKASVFGALITGVLGIAGTYMTIHSQISEKDAEIAKLARDYAERTDLSHAATLARIDALTVKADQRISDLRKEYDDRMAMSDTENSFEKYRLHAEYAAKIRSLVRGSYAERRLDLKPYEVKRDQRIIADFEDSFPMKDFFMFLEKTANEGQRSYLAALSQKRRDADYDLSVYLAGIQDEIVEESPYVRDKKLAFYTNLVRKTSIADQANAEFFSAVGSLTSRKARN